MPKRKSVCQREWGRFRFTYETVVDAPHARHLHLWDPAPVLPFLLIAAPQEGHLTAFISSSLEIGNLTA